MNLVPQDYFLALMGAANALWSWKLFGVLNRLDTSLSEMRGMIKGWNLDERVTALERKAGRAPHGPA